MSTTFQFEDDEDESVTGPTFDYRGKVWTCAPQIGIGAVRRLVNAEKDGDSLAAIYFLTAIVTTAGWETVVDAMPPKTAYKIATALMKFYGGDKPDPATKAPTTKKVSKGAAAD